MSELPKIADLLNHIYDAALDATLWPQVLRRTACLVGGISGAIYSRDTSSAAGDFHCSVDLDPYFSALYQTHYLPLSPLLPYEERLPAGTVFSASDAMPYSDLCASVFFNEWARPQGFSDFIGVVLEKSPGRMAKLFINRHERQGLVDEGARRHMQLLAPHFRRAIAIGRLIERREVEAVALTEVVERFSVAVVCVDSAGRLVHANGQAVEMLERGELLTWTDGKPTPTDPRAAIRLEAVLDRMRRTRDASGGWDVAVPRAARGGDQLTVDILPLTGGTRRRALAPAAAAAILVSKSRSDLSLRTNVAAKLYDLTQAESRVLEILLSGSTIGRVATRLGISEATVKTHLQHIFDKTGARRQVDLLRLITGADHQSAMRNVRSGGPELSSSRDHREQSADEMSSEPLV